MGKAKAKAKALVGVASKAGRKAARKDVPLKTLVIKASTEKRYREAIFRFFHWMEDENIVFPTSLYDFDTVLSEYIGWLWEEGEGRAQAANATAGLQHFSPHLRRKLPCVWRLLNAWQKHEIPCRATPFTTQTVEAVAGVFFHKKAPQMALAMLVGFHCILRTGELMGVKSKDIDVSPDHKTAVLNLGLTKSGQRQGAAESVVLYDRPLIRLISAWQFGSAPGDSLVACGPFQFRREFRQAIATLHLKDDWDFKPYSLRRGGATHDFREHGQLSRTVVWGRWASAKSARIYINDGLATLASFKMSPKTQQAVKKFREKYDKATHLAHA